MSVYHILESLGKDTKRTYKLNVISQNKDNPTFCKVLELALNPYINFYIKKIPDYTTNGNNISLDEALEKLSALSSRAVTGNAAIDYLTNILNDVSAEDAIVISRIIKKDLRCGVAESTVNDAIPDLIPTYPCLLATAYSASAVGGISFPAYSQLKADGVRANAYVEDDGSVTICGRSGKPIGLLGYLDKDIIELSTAFGVKQMFFDGELIVLGDDGSIMSRKAGNGIINKAIRGTISDKEASMVKFQIWDAFPKEEFVCGKSAQPYRARFDALIDAFNNYNSTVSNARVSIIPYRIINSIEEADLHFQEMLSLGNEGVILKNYTGIWSNTRSKDLVKMKAEKETDLEIIGFNPGTGQFENMVGSIICSSADRLLEVSISGFDIPTRQWITENQDKLLGTIVTVMYNEKITNKSANRSGIYSLFLPRFVEFRTDKTVADSIDDIK